MATENRLTDAKLRSASRERDGMYLTDGGGLRILLHPAPAGGGRGTRTAIYDFKVSDPDGRRTSRRLTLGTIGPGFGLADARRARDAARDLLRQGLDPAAQRRIERESAAEAERARLVEIEGQRTVAEAFEQWRVLYLAARRPDGGFAHRADGGAYVAATFKKHVLPAIGDSPLRAVRRSDVASTVDAITAAGRLRTATATLALLKQFFRWALAREWVDSDPTTLLSAKDFGGRTAPRQRTLTMEEIAILSERLKTVPKRLRHVVWLLLATGARIGELAGARITDFDLGAAEWTIPITKNGRPHLVHLSGFASRHVRALAEIAKGSDWLLPARDRTRPMEAKALGKHVTDRQRETPLQGRTKKVSALRLPGELWTPHDLRRTMASRMQDLGVAPHVIERCLNHTPQGIVGIYQTSDLLPERRDAFERWGGALTEIEESRQKTGAKIVALADRRRAR